MTPEEAHIAFWLFSYLIMGFVTLFIYDIISERTKRYKGENTLVYTFWFIVFPSVIICLLYRMFIRFGKNIKVVYNNIKDAFTYESI